MYPHCFPSAVSTETIGSIFLWDPGCRLSVQRRKMPWAAYAFPPQSRFRPLFSNAIFITMIYALAASTELLLCILPRFTYKILLEDSAAEKKQQLVWQIKYFGGVNISSRVQWTVAFGQNLGKNRSSWEIWEAAVLKSNFPTFCFWVLIIFMLISLRRSNGASRWIAPATIC